MQVKTWKPRLEVRPQRPAYRDAVTETDNAPRDFRERMEQHRERAVWVLALADMREFV